MVLLTSWRFWVVLLSFFGCTWVSLFVLNSSELFSVLLIAAGLASIFLLNKSKNPSSGQDTPSGRSAHRSPIAVALLIGVLAVFVLAVLLLLAFLGVFGGTPI